MTASTLQSYIAGRWVGQQAGTALRSAVNGVTVAHSHAEALDFGEALHHARTVGLPGLLKLDFQQRAERLSADPDRPGACRLFFAFKLSRWPAAAASREPAPCPQPAFPVAWPSPPGSRR